MPYQVSSNCPECKSIASFVIGLWPQHLGVFICRGCQTLVNIPLETANCPGCGYQPRVEEFYDYAYAIPYFNGPPSEELEPGPECPKCRKGRLVFQLTSHFNVGRLGTPKNEERPWLGRDYLEKAIFVYAIMAVCSEFDLPPDQILAYYNLDIPVSLIGHRRISIPIIMDIRAHLLAAAMTGEIPFTITPKLQQAVDEKNSLFKAITEHGRLSLKRKWWEFWK